MLKHLGQFSDFGIERFLADKTTMSTGCSQLIDYDTKEHVGTKVEGVFTRDDTQYKQKNGENVTNLYNKIVYKVMKKGLNVPVGSIIVPVNPKATVYGEYRNQLSITCEDIQIISQQSVQSQQTTPAQGGVSNVKKELISKTQ